jgi:Peptidase inhibitor family I36
MKRPRRVLVAVGMATATLAAFVTLAVTASTPALAGSRATQETVQLTAMAVIPHQAFDNCPGGRWCLYYGPNGQPLCWDSLSTVRYLSDYGCRNEDWSFANRTSGLVRMYYSPNLGGDWVCVNSGWYSNNLENQAYRFNNGTSGVAGGQGELIWRNVASVEVASGKCSNPLPELG